MEISVADEPPTDRMSTKRLVTPSAVLQNSNLTDAQASFWLGQHIQRDIRIDSHATTFAFHLKGQLNRTHFQTAFQRLIDRSDALRSVIVEAGGIPQRITRDHLTYQVPCVSLSAEGDPGRAFREWVERRWAEAVNWHERSFDSALINLLQDHSVWYLQLHHTVGDARTFWLVTQLVGEFYQALTDGRSDLISPNAAADFEDYADFEGRFRSSRRHVRNAEYWHQKITTIKTAPGMAGSIESEQALRTYRISYWLGAERSERVRELISRYGLFSATVPFLAILFACLSRPDRSPFAIGVTFDGRPDGFQDTIGAFTRTCPVQAAIDSNDTLISFLRKVQLEVVQAGQHQHYGVRNPITKRIWNVLFNHLSVEFRDFAGMEIDAELLRSGYSNYPLSVHLRHFRGDGDFALDFDFNAGRFSGSRGQELVDKYIELLDHLITGGEAPLAAFLSTASPRIIPETEPAVIETREPLALREVETAQDAAPHSATEATLVRIWGALLSLNLDQVPVTANFYDLGGDSIMSLEMILEAREAGLNLEPADVAAHQTIAELARAADRARGGARPAERQPGGAGPVPLSPAQHRFFATTPVDPHHWNLSYLFQAAAPLDVALLTRAIVAVRAQHSALRLSFRSERQQWLQIEDDAVETVAVSGVDLGNATAAERSAAITRITADAQARLDLESGPLLRLIAFEPGEGAKAHLFLCAHHLIVDPISISIVINDLQRAYEQLRRKEPVRLSPVPTGFPEWGKFTADYARGAARNEMDFWRSVVDDAALTIENYPLPRDFAGGANTSRSLEQLTVSLGEEETRALLHDLPKTLHTEIEDALLTALASILGEWASTDRVCMMLERHGREHIASGIDLSRTVGWLVSAFPVVLPVPGAPDTGGVAAVRDQLLAIPHKGIGYGLLRYLSEDRVIRDALTLPVEPEVMFTYLGQSGGSREAGLLTLLDHPLGPQRSLRRPRRHLLNIVTRVRQHRLQTVWNWSCNVHRSATIERLADGFCTALRRLIDSPLCAARPGRLERR
jgi:non-ribosomal peptide synthase protein (TIGR01720 family)